MTRFSVAVLSHGEQGKDLASSQANLQRCLRSIGDGISSNLIGEIRILLNTPGKALHRLAEFEADRLSRLGVSVLVAYSDTNRFKYPMLRAALYRLPGILGRLMWFDDDSYNVSGAKLFQLAAEALDNCDFIGQPWTIRGGLSEAKLEWIRNTTWGRQAKETSLVFPQGAWWAARVEWLRQYNWPHPQLRHRGGDVLTGALLRETSTQWAMLPKASHDVVPLVMINAGATGKHSKSPRRSYDETPLGDWVPTSEEVAAMHDFDLQTYRYVKGRRIEV